MTTVRELMKNKSTRAVLTALESESVHEAMKLMSEENVGALIIVDGEKVVGILTDKDCTRKILLHERSARSTTVSEVMSKNVVFVTSDDVAEACMALMIKEGIAHLPVIDQNALIGVISMGDLARAIISDHESLLDQLQNYISGDRGIVVHPERAAASTRKID